MKVDVSMATMDYDVIGQGIPVVMIHGFCLDKNVMKGAYEPIFRSMEGFKRIYVDLPAMGDSIEKNGLNSSEHILKCLLEFIDHILGDEKFLVVGQSYGGYLAQGIIAAIPERTLGLGLLCPVIIAESDDRDLPEHQLMVDDRKNIAYDDEELFNDFVEFAVVVKQATYDRFIADILTGLKKATNEILEVIREEHYALTPEPYVSLSAYDKPSLILVGRQDATVGYRDAMRLDNPLTNVSIAMVNGAGHSLQYDQEGIFTMLTKEWIESFLDD